MRGESQYKIVEIHFARLSNKHIPYFTYMIVCGPRGGKYLLDPYNVQYMLVSQIGGGALPRLDPLISSYAHRNNIYMLYTGPDSFGDKDLSVIAKRLNAHPLIRRSNRTDYYTLCNKLDLTKIIKGA